VAHYPHRWSGSHPLRSHIIDGGKSCASFAVRRCIAGGHESGSQSIQSSAGGTRAWRLPPQLDERFWAPKDSLAVALFVWLGDRPIPNVPPLGRPLHLDLGQRQRPLLSGSNALLIAMNHALPPRLRGTWAAAMSQIAAQFHTT
jgi:hypothetical protein